MKTIRALLIFSLLAAFAFVGSGCTTHTAMGKTDTVLLGGLYTSREGAYEKQSLNTFPVNSDRASPSSRLTGNEVSILWGLISFVDQ